MKKAIIYTTKGDDGTTQLLRGERVAKDDVRVEAYGTIDELSACVALLQSEGEVCDKHMRFLATLQNNLFALSAFLSDTCSDASSPINADDVATLEQLIDSMESALPPMRGFLLPPTRGAAAMANVCRTVCRRAERRMVTLSHQIPIPTATAAFINRLSDYFFLLSRLLNDGDEKIWEKPCK